MEWLFVLKPWRVFFLASRSLSLDGESPVKSERTRSSSGDSDRTRRTLLQILANTREYHGIAWTFLWLVSQTWLVLSWKKIGRSRTDLLEICMVWRVKSTGRVGHGVVSGPLDSAPCGWRDVEKGRVKKLRGQKYHEVNQTPHGSFWVEAEEMWSYISINSCMGNSTGNSGFEPHL